MAYFKRSFSRKADYIKKDNGKFKYVGENSGNYILVLTAKDKQTKKQREFSHLPIPHVVAIHDRPNLLYYHHKVWSRYEVQYFWWWCDYSIEKMQECINNKELGVKLAQARNMATMLMNKRRISHKQAWDHNPDNRRKIVINNTVYTPEASPSYLEYDKLSLEYRQSELRNMKMALKIFEKPCLLYTFNGDSFTPPYTKL